ncbi:MAG: hypothetical protein R3F08_08370 [Dokdonella sp.]|nr:hypothetical protein [Dokdonella sp.]MCB1571558.1 hypothetical protein [Xanthomonadales bacterium]MCB1574663.1 hypothetical protein [Xanthomonadales bacterium]MCB1577812.1 hypothetical protein [Xanthomonadales bacterium]
MNIRTSIAALAFCLASTVTFAATPASPTANPGSPATASSPGTKSTAAMHCGRGHVLQNGKCVAKNKTTPKK